MQLNAITTLAATLPIAPPIQQTAKCGKWVGGEQAIGSANSTHVQYALNTPSRPLPTRECQNLYQTPIEIVA